MSGIKFSNTTPAAPAGKILVTFQADGNGDISAYSAGTGGVNSQTVNYLIVAGDNGKIVSMHGTSLTATLPASAPSTTFEVFIANTSSTYLTLARNGHNIDGAASNVSIPPGQGLYISTDGTNWFTSRGMGNVYHVVTLTNGQLITGIGADGIGVGDLSGDVTTSGGTATTLANTSVTPGSYTNTNLTVDSKGRITAASNGSSGSGTVGGVNLQTVNYTILSGDAGKIVVMNGSSLTVKLPASPPSSTFAVFVANINASNLTLDPNGPNLDGSAGTVTIPQFQGMFISTDGTNYYSERGMSSGGGGGTVTTTGSPASGNLTKFSGATSITNGDLSGDVTTAGTLVTTLGNIPDGVTQAGKIVETEIAAPATPAAGKIDIWADSTDHRFHDKNSSGVIGTTVVADTGAANNFLTAISAAGVISKAQPSFANISGTASAAQIPALTGDVTKPSGVSTTTLVNIPDGVTQAGKIVETEIAAPATPSAGTVDIYADSTDHRFHDKNSSGVIGTTVVADTGATHNFLTAISAAGVISKAQPSFSDLAVATGDVSFSTAAANKLTNVHDPTNPQDVATKAYVDAQFTSGNMVAGVNNQTGTSYTFQNTDRAKLVTFSNTAAIAGTLPQAGSGGSFSNTWFVWVENRGTGMLTITPTTSTIDGGTSITLANGCGIGIFSDGSNYFTEQGNVASLQTVATGSTSFTAGQTQNFSLVMPKATLMFQVTEAASKKFRLRLYSTSAARASDAARPYSVPILLGPQNKLILDLFIDQSSAVTPFFLSPAILGVNGDGTPATTIYASVTSFESTTQNINVTVSFIPLGN